MSDKDFIIKKLSLMKKDKQSVFDKLVEPLQEMAEQGEITKKIKVPADGNWFKLSFDAVQIKKDRLVITAHRVVNGLIPSNYNPEEKEYVVEFNGTRAAYLKGYCKFHARYGWPYIGWDIRSYVNHPTDSSTRVYVHGFIAHEELRKLILAMESACATTNIYNRYINDNLMRFQNGIKAGKSIQDIERAWSRGLMESLGYHHAEAFDIGHPTGGWKDVAVHWCKRSRDLRA